jgi:UDP-glucose 4-epimerase
MKILLIGGNGFIGSHLADRLLNDGHSVRIFDAVHERFRAPNREIDYRIANLNDIPALAEAMMDIDTVLHLASTSVPSTSGADMVNDIQNNLVTSVGVLNIAIRHRIKKFVYFSSGGAVYGNPECLPVSENHSRNPVSPYGIIKAAMEQYIKFYHSQHGLEYLILRPSNPYGPRQGHFVAQGVISTFLRKSAAGETLQVFGNGCARKDYIYIDDFAAIVSELIRSNQSGTYNTGSGTGTSLNEILKHIDTVTGKENRVEYTGEKQYDVTNFILDISRLKTKMPGFEFTGIEHGIRATWEWIKNVYVK